MVMFVGGTFGVLRATGAVDAGVDRLLYLTSGNVYLLSAALMILLASGSTFLGFSSEYVAIIPVVLVLGRRLQLPNLFAPAIVALADLLGYAASVTNPIALGVAQPLAGVPVFSGLVPRLGIFIVLVSVSLSYVFSYLRRQPRMSHQSEAAKLSGRQSAVLLSLVLGGGFLVLGTSLWSWGTTEHAAVFLGLATFIALLGGGPPQKAADAFLDGSKVMVLPCLLIGFGSAVGILLDNSQVMASIVHGISQMIRGNRPGVVAVGLMGAEMCFSILIPSVSAKAALSVPALTPVALLSHVSGQTTVTALLLGSGMTNMITPTNPLLLAFLAAAKVDYSEWVRFVAPLFIGFTLFSAAVVFLMASYGL